MNRFVVLILFIFITSCASVQHGGLTFSSNDGYDFHNVPKHGFAEMSQDQKVCDGDNKVKGGYWVQLRQPNKGETESEYKTYLKAEETRAGLCAEAATWCSTNLNIFCSPTDDKCLKESRSAGIRNTCKVRVKDPQNKPHLWPITTQIGDQSWIVCGTSLDEYSSPPAKTTSMNKSWNKKQENWMQFCLKSRSKEDCDAIVAETESPTYFVTPDANRWAVQIVNQTKPTVTREGGRIFGSIKVDLTPACKADLIEIRH